MATVHRVGVTVGDTSVTEAVFSTTLDTLLAPRKRSGVELATVPFGETDMIRRYAGQYGHTLREFPLASDALLCNVDEIVVFTDIEDDITKLLVQTARERGICIHVVLVEPLPYD